MRESLERWRANFITGLVVVLPAVVSLAICRWLFGTVSNVTDGLVFFVPQRLTHADAGRGEMFWYWSLLALGLGMVLVALVGRATRYYIGRRLIRAVDQLLSSVPLLNKIYGTLKQVNEAFSTGTKSTFRQVVLVQYPRLGLYTIGFITSDEIPEASSKLGQAMVGVFIPTTPNPTSGFLLVVPHDQITRMDMSVADAVRYIISLGSVVPDKQVRDALVTGPIER
jgi:uncharacterized membrane protein